MSKSLVLVNGGENTEEQTGQNYEKPGGNEADHTSDVIKT